MIGITSAINWLGDQVTGWLDRTIDSELNRAGALWLAKSRSLAPVNTGELVAKEDYQVANRTLILIMGAEHDVFQEFGTRFLHPRPHVRPALLEMQRIFGTSVELQFNRPGGGQWGGLFAHQGGFVEPSRIQRKPLTARQRQHVKQNLIPISKRLHRGMVKRAKVRVRRFE